ncbi:hypothetical protein ROZALSC1DRAFT_20414 [Rozella allomycis CSF55]|uniref:Uncharacterized protein n=1 Tax=Rozella allomycis (strain CSF55) TaxID=988480 RepID=A0A4P9YPB7_ROZAC|nr:hypothetical protein ROZALSC1DRAFT_20414 [Rozella allomycis CSF55]
MLKFPTTFAAKFMPSKYVRNRFMNSSTLQPIRFNRCTALRAFRYVLPVVPDPTPTDATRRFRKGNWNLFSAVRVSIGGNQIDYIQNYNELHTILNETASEEQLAAAGDKSSYWNEGVDGTTELTAWSQSSRIYTLRLQLHLRTGMLGMNKLVPCISLVEKLHLK